MPQENYCWQGKLQRIVKLASQNAQNAWTGIRYFSCGMKGLPRPPAEDSGDHSQAADSHPALALFVSANHKLQLTFLKHADGSSKTKNSQIFDVTLLHPGGPPSVQFKENICARCMKKSHLRMHCLLHGRDSNRWRWQWLWDCILENLLHTVLETKIRVKNSYQQRFCAARIFQRIENLEKPHRLSQISRALKTSRCLRLRLRNPKFSLATQRKKERKKERKSSPRYGCDQRDNEHRQARYWPPPPPAPSSPSS